jgi:DNA-3-methyladenine glycosylase
MRKLERNFYKRNTLEVSKDLLGKYLVHIVDGEELIARIVEVEGYMGPDDKAAHSFGGRRTERNEIMYGEAGFAYVFTIYGMYYCMNIVTEQIGIPRAVLIRALEPIKGMEKMALLRYSKNYEELSNREKLGLTNGPGKLCIAMNIVRADNGEDMCGDRMYLLQDDSVEHIEIVESKRINIDYAEEYKDVLWRYYIKGNKYVSKK